MKAKAVGLLCVVLFIFCPMTTTSYNSENQIDSKSQQVKNRFDTSESWYIESSPIHISNDTDFASQASANSWNGNGSEIDPYIIEDYNITISGTSAVHIVNTTAFFEIRGCLLVGGTGGILLENVTNADVWNNTIQGIDGPGLLVAESNAITARNNTIRNIIGTDSPGLYSMSSEFCEFSNNTIQNIDGQGVLADYTNNCSIIANVVSGTNKDGIRLRDSSENNITYNEIMNSDMSGIKLGNSHGCRIERNLVSHCLSDGISMEMSSHSIIQDNVFYESGAYSLDLAGDYTDIIGNTFYKSQMQGFRCQSGNNYVTQNNFIENNLYFSETTTYIVDSGTNNDINGNYYDSWTWPDENEDDIVDRSYLYGVEQSDDEPHVLVFQTDLMHILTKPRLIYPNETIAGEKFWEITKIIWGVSSDTFGHDVTYNVSVSADGGSSWSEIAHNLTDSSLDWMSSDFTESNEYRFRILAQCTEGLISEYITGAEYEVKNHTLSFPTIIAPNGGESIVGNYTIMWNSAVESWGLPVTYQVYYSPDAGDTWNELVSDSEETTFLWDIRSIPDGNQYLIRVVARSEAGLMSEDVSDSVFTISRPNVTIIVISIAGGAIVILAVAYLFRKRGTR